MHNDLRTLLNFLGEFLSASAFKSRSKVAFSASGCKTDFLVKGLSLQRTQQGRVAYRQKSGPFTLDLQVEHAIVTPDTATRKLATSSDIVSLTKSSTTDDGPWSRISQTKLNDFLQLSSWQDHDDDVGRWTVRLWTQRLFGGLLCSRGFLPFIMTPSCHYVQFDKAFWVSKFRRWKLSSWGCFFTLSQSKSHFKPSSAQNKIQSNVDIVIVRFRDSVPIDGDLTVNTRRLWHM